MQLSEISGQNLPHAHLIDRAQLPRDGSKLPAPDHARQNGRKLRLNAHALRQIRVLCQLGQGDIEHRWLHGEHTGGDLPGCADGDGQLRLPGNAVVARRLVIRVQTRGRGTAALCGQLRDHIAPHGVDGGRREHQIGVQRRTDGGAQIRRSAGFFQLLLQILRRERPVDRLLRHGAAGPAEVAVRVLDGELRRLSAADHGVEAHADALRLTLFIGGAGRGEQVGRVLTLLTAAKHIAAGLAPEIAVGKALPGEGRLQLLQIGRRQLAAV